MLALLRFWPLIPLGLLAILGVFLVDDYGISWDEGQQRLIGYVAYNYVTQTLFPAWIEPLYGIPALMEFRDRDYGVVFELPAVALERWLGLGDTRAVFLLRHYLNYLVFLGGVAAMFWMGRQRYNSVLAGLLAATLLLLSPRFFAEAFYNSKDIVFMAAFAFAMSTMFSFINHPTVKSALLHALACAIATDIRIMGLMIVLGTLTVLLIQGFRGDIPWRRLGVLVLTYGVATSGLIVAFFPFLWADPIGHLQLAFENMSQFQRWNGDILFFGKFISGYEIPWHYSLVWIGLTTPPVYLLLFIAGVGATLYQLLKARMRLWQNTQALQDLIALALFTLPLLMVIALNSVLYNGWRQLYFIYPAFIFLALRGAHVLFSTGKPTRIALIALLTVSFITTSSWMVRAHPLQNVYFNFMAGNEIRARFEFDYWGLANRQALEFLLAYDDAEQIRVVPRSFTPLEFTVPILRAEDRSRLVFPENTDQPHYLINNYYGWERHGDLMTQPNHYKLIHQIKAVDEVVLSIYQWVPPDS